MLYVMLVVLLTVCHISHAEPEPNPFPGFESERVGVLVEPKWGFCAVGDFREGMSWVLQLDDTYTWGVGHFGYVNNQGEVVIPLEHFITDAFGWYEPPHFSDGMVYINPSSEYDFFSDYEHPYPLVVGYLNREGERVDPAEHERPSASVGTDTDVPIADARRDKVGFVDKKGVVVIPFEFDLDHSLYHGAGVFRDFHEGLAAVMRGEPYGYPVGKQQWGFIDTAGYIVIPLRYDKVNDFSEGRAVVGNVGERGLAWGIIDREGNEILPPGAYGGIMCFSEGLAAVGKSWHWGFIDPDGNEVIEPQYEDALPFSQGLAAVSVSVGEAWYDRKWGFIDTTGEVVVPFIFDEVRSFSEGIAWVKYNGSWGLLMIKE
jgi:hypothetical protein